jgi:hypothetical protein
LGTITKFGKESSLDTEQEKYKHQLTAEPWEPNNLFAVKFIKRKYEISVLSQT